MAVQKIRLYLEPSSIADIAHACQMDVKRQFQFLIYDENGTYSIPSGASVSINGQKPDGYLFDYDESDYVSGTHVISKTGNVVTVYTTPQMTACEGNVACQIRISQNGSDIGILPFTMHVQKTPLADEQGYSQSDLPSIVRKYNEFCEDAEAWATGKRNGVDVGSSDETYHNNSKYYKEQAASSATTASNKAGEAATSASNSAGSATLAESYAKGGTNSRSGENTDNAKYYKEQAATSESNASDSAQTATTKASNAAASATLAESYAKGGTSSRTGENTDNAKYYKEQAATSETNAGNSASAANIDALKAEGYAVGKQNGTNVSSTSPYYHSNAAYFSDQAGAKAAIAESNAATAIEKASQATAKATAADNSAQDSEAWAVGKRGGSDVPSSDETYHNNSKYYASQASGSAGTAQMAASDAAAAISTIRSLIDMSTFSVDFVTGELMYTASPYTFSINPTTGNLEWEVA